MVFLIEHEGFGTRELRTIMPLKADRGKANWRLFHAVQITSIDAPVWSGLKFFSPTASERGGIISLARLREQGLDHVTWRQT